MDKREIKFRTWHKEERDGDTVLPGWMNYEPEYGQYATVLQETRDEVGYVNPVSTALARCQVNRIFTESKSPMMQYIGLKDKNGKEIWEGDVIEYTTGMKEIGTFQVHREEVKFETFNHHGDFEVAGFTILYGANHVEIIGNIYENPELLATNTETQ